MWVHYVFPPIRGEQADPKFPLNRRNRAVKNAARSLVTLEMTEYRFLGRSRQRAALP